MITATAITVNTIVIDVPMLNAAPLFRSICRVRKPAQEPDRRMMSQRVDHHDLGHHVQGQHRYGDADDHRELPAPGRLGVGRWLALACYRRSSRCLHVTHSTARGNAISRAFPIGCPQDSHTPYDPASIRASTFSVCSSRFRALLVMANS